MSLRTQAAADAKAILEDTNGFGYPITVSDPDCVSADLVGFSTDVSQVIDPETGQAVTGRSASVVLRLSTLATAGLGIPRAVADRSLRPWVVRFNDIDGTPHTFKVQEAMPDRAIGIVVCMLESYRPETPF